MQSPWWPDLPADLLCEISGRLHYAADFVRFHAVCKPWRESHELPTRKKTADQFLPWLLARNKKHDDSLKFRCVFSKSSYFAPLPISSGTGYNWVASADGTAVYNFTAGPTLTKPLTGDVTHLRPFIDGQWEEEDPSGIMYKDGTVLLYSTYRRSYDGAGEFKAALLRPGDDDWTVVQRTIESPYHAMFCIAYHSGKILATIERRFWHVVTTTTALSSDDLLVRTPSTVPLKRDGYYYDYGHVLESCGELLWATVHTRTGFWQEYEKGAIDLARALLVSVHALEEVPNPRWVRKKGVSLANLVLFLGWPNSFSVDASRLGMKGGFAYFTHIENEFGVYRCNLINNKTECIECLPKGYEMRTWLVPQPTIIAQQHQGLATTSRRNNSVIRRDRETS